MTTAEQLAQLREGGAKRFLFTATVKHVEGYQTFFVDAETQEEAEAGIENGNGQIYEHELEVTDLDDFILDRVTTTDDFGDYPPISEADLVRMGYDAALCEMLPGIQYMDLPDGGSVTPLEQVRRMVADYRQRIAELEARTVTVKLPHQFKTSMYGTPLYEQCDILAMLAAAGINLTVEG
ncbi:hypothetical protein [Atlantibacter subterraneus]|uniref:hypothetical protein n=1 Tax=Atlantibacter subterraneus TaxID=255519 RepID=UPI00289F812E|nr:hypothetical protein [Atlantibacter subterranea]